jgi:hypothetical protein
MSILVSVVMTASYLALAEGQRRGRQKEDADSTKIREMHAEVQAVGR